jgi:ribosomal-protein-alanine N-acetyltransferase
MVALSYPDPDLSDGKIYLRRWRETDLGCIEEAATDPRIPAGTSVPAVFSVDEATAFVHRQWSRAQDGVGVSLAVAEVRSDQAVGLAILNIRPQPGVAGIGYWIVPSARGQGYATSAALLLADWGLRKLGLQRIEAWVEPDNPSSQRVLVAAGFESEGRLRNFLRSGDQPRDALVLSKVTSSARPRNDQAPDESAGNVGGRS